MRTLIRGALIALAIYALFPTSRVAAHGQVGERKFIEPFVTEDANIKNEATVQGIFTDRADKNRWELRYEVEKQLNEKTSLFIEHGATFNFVGEEDEAEEAEEEKEREEAFLEASESPEPEDGFENLEVGIKREIWRSGRHEAILSLAAAVEVPTGTERVDAEQNPALEFVALYAKGFGDVPERIRVLRPFFLMGDLRLETPLGEGRPINEFAWNVLVGYDLSLLHEYVDFPEFFEPVVLVTEFNFETAVNGPGRAEVEAFVTPGIVYRTDRIQAGVAFQLPLNDDAEFDFAVLPTIAIFYDEIFPFLGRDLLPF